MKKTAPKKSPKTVKKEEEVTKPEVKAPLIQSEEVMPEESASISVVGTTPEDSKTPTSIDVPSVPIDTPLKIDSAEQNLEGDEPRLEKSNRKIFIVGIIITIVVILVTAVFGFYFLKQDYNQENIKEEKVEITLTPTPTPKVSLDRSEWSIEVLNGTPIPGLAKELADKLEKLGYKIILTGNAENKDYKDSQILVISEADSDEIELLLNDIKKEIDISSSSGDLEDSTASARIIIGSDYNTRD